MFPIGGLEGILVASMAVEDTDVRPPTPIMERISALWKPGLGALVRFDCDDSMHPAFNFGQFQASRPQVSSSLTSTSRSWLPPP